VTLKPARGAATKAGQIEQNAQIYSTKYAPNPFKIDSPSNTIILKKVMFYLGKTTHFVI